MSRVMETPPFSTQAPSSSKMCIRDSYQLAFPEVSFKVCPVPCYNITKENWYKTEAGLHRVLGELARCGHQFVGDIEIYLL